MSNSLNFLNKPATPAKTIGPQPKPGSTGSTAAPKAAFLDRSNPWAVGSTGSPTAGGKGAPPPPAYNPLPQNAPAKRAAPRSPSTSSGNGQRADIPNRGYNYTDASYTGATPQQRAREIDQAEMNAQVTRQRRDKERQAAAQTQPIKVQARAMAQPVAQDWMPDVPVWLETAVMGNAGTNPYLRQQQGDDYRAQPLPVYGAPDAYIRQQQGDDYRYATPPPQPAPVPGQPWQMAPTAEQAMAMRPIGQPAPTRATPQAAPVPGQLAPTAEQALAMRPPQPTPQPIAPAAPQTATGVNVPATTPAASTTYSAPDWASDRFYGFAPPGPIMAAAPPGMHWATPQYTNFGMRMLRSEQVLAGENARRQRDAAGGFGALMQAGTYRPWSSYSPAEKYYLRYGVMPPGVQAAPPAWVTASAAQRQSTAPAAPPTEPEYAQAPAQAAQFAKNNQMVLAINPQAATTGVTEQDANTVAREIAKRYMPDKDVSTLTLAEIGAILAMSYTPPPGLEQQFGNDMDWLSQLIQTE